MKIGYLNEYRGYVGSIGYDPEDKIYYGSLQNIDDSIIYHAKFGDELLQRYHEAIDDYVEMRKSINLMG